ncbi:MAG: endonuclease V [candidate division Zixibacteria bacterium]|nr:endonuclease V [candidate division Zixibacteria bacterium]
MQLIKSFIDICENRNIKEAPEFQKSLVSLINSPADREKIETICAFDVSYDKQSRTNYTSVIVMGYHDHQVIESKSVIREATFPYIPGLLAFREGPSIIEAYLKLRIKPDILLFDGQGYAHPRRMGIATMIGILLDKPSIGCAKTCLIGEWENPKNIRGAATPLIHKEEQIGNVLRTRIGVIPVFVSIGNRIDLQNATEIVLNCCTTFRLPEPIREAHRLANEIRNKRTGR